MVNERIWWNEKQCYGFKKCPSWLREAYIKGSSYKCSECWNRFDTLEIHRIIRGNAGGLYTVCLLNYKGNNVKVCCPRCHKRLHSQENGCRNK